MEFFRQEYWSGLPFLPPGYLPNPGGEPTSPALAGGFFTNWATQEAPTSLYQHENVSVIQCNHQGYIQVSSILLDIFLSSEDYSHVQT